MLRRHSQSIKHWLFIALFLASLITCLGFNVIGSQSGGMLAGAAAFAQSANANQIEPVRSPADSGSHSASQLVQQGVDFYQAGDYQAAITQWRAALDLAQQTGRLSDIVIIQENLARVYQQLGRADQAILYWEQAAAVYQQLGDSQQVGRVLVEQAQAHSQLGQPRRAIALLCGHSEVDACVEGSALQLAQANGDRPTEIAAFGSLGDA